MDNQVINDDFKAQFEQASNQNRSQEQMPPGQQMPMGGQQMPMGGQYMGGPPMGGQPGGTAGGGQGFSEDILDPNFMRPFPEIIDVVRIQSFTEVKSVWREGIKTLEDVFAEYLVRINEEFMRKCEEFERIRRQLLANHEWLNAYYDQMRRNLDMKRLEIAAERVQWRSEIDDIKNFTKLDSEVIALNVGGTHHLMTERDVLMLVPGSLLNKMFSGMHECKKINDEVFLDRDGKTFLNLVNYLRNGMQVFPEFQDKNDEIHFFQELDYWGIPVKSGVKYHMQNQKMQSYQHVVVDTQSEKSTRKPMPQQQPQQQAFIETRQETYQHPPPVQVYKQSYEKIEQRGERLTPNKPPPDFDDEYQEVHTEDSHGVALRAAKEKWNELGPLRLEDIVANSSESIDQTMKFGQSKYNKYIIGQLGQNGKVSGVGKEINHIIYEGQFKDDIYNGYGRFIYSNGNFYIGNWLDGKRSGYGRLVDKSGRIYEGQWQYSKFMGE